MWWDCSGLYPVRAENSSRRAREPSISVDTRPTAQQFLRKEKLSLTLCLCGPTQLTPHQGFLPLMLLASLSGLLRFQTALKVIWSQAYLKQIRRLICFTNSQIWVTSKIWEQFKLFTLHSDTKSTFISLLHPQHFSCFMKLRLFFPSINPAVQVPYLSKED